MQQERKRRVIYRTDEQRVPTDTFTDTDNSNDISRSSSVSVKDRVAHNKKTKLKQRRSDSDGFESRATFTPFYGQPSSAWMANTQYMPQPGQQYHGSMQSPHPTPPGPYDQSVQSHGPFQSHWNGTPQMIPLHGSPGYGQMQPVCDAVFTIMFDKLIQSSRTLRLMWHILPEVFHSKLPLHHTYRT